MALQLGGFKILIKIKIFKLNPPTSRLPRSQKRPTYFLFNWIVCTQKVSLSTTDKEDYRTHPTARDQHKQNTHEEEWQIFNKALGNTFPFPSNFQNKRT